MLRRDLLKALAAFVTAAPAATQSVIRSEPPFSGAGKPAVSAKSPPVAFTPPTAPAEPEPAVFALPEQDIDPFTLEEYDPADFVDAHDACPCPPLPPQCGKKACVLPEMQALREALWSGDQLPVSIDIGAGTAGTTITFFPPESAARLGTDEHKQAIARHAIATMIPTCAVIYNGNSACEVTFRRIEA